MPWYALLIRTWACYSEPGQPRPRTEQTAHVRNSGFTCGTRWSPGHCRTQPIHDGSWGSHTQARDAAFTGTRQTRPPTTATFPRRTAAKSPPQQRDMSTLQVDSHHLQHRLFPHQQAKKSPFQQHVVSYHPNFHPSQINAAIPTLSCHNSTRATGELRATLLGNHANAALRTALRMDHRKNGPSTV